MLDAFVLGPRERRHRRGVHRTPPGSPPGPLTTIQRSCRCEAPAVIANPLDVRNWVDSGVRLLPGRGVRPGVACVPPHSYHWAGIPRPSPPPWGTGAGKPMTTNSIRLLKRLTSPTPAATASSSSSARRRSNGPSADCSPLGGGDWLFASRHASPELSDGLGLPLPQDHRRLQLLLQSTVVWRSLDAPSGRLRHRGTCLVFSGKPGRGKTHLAIAIAYRAIQNGFYALFMTAAQFIDELSSRLP